MPNLAANFEIQVNGSKLEAGVTQFVTSVEFESVDGIPDEIRIQLNNPGSVLTKSRIFAPGNEVSLFIGSDHVLWHVGRCRIERIKPRFGAAGNTLEVVALTKDHLMSKNEPQHSDKKKNPKKKTGRVFPNQTIMDAIEARAKSYGFSLDIDYYAVPDHDWARLQPTGMNDFEFIQGFANQWGCLWWVDGDENGVWTFHFKDAAKYKSQYKETTFHFGGNDSNFEYDGEMAFQDLKTSIIVEAKNIDTKKMMIAEIAAEDVASDDGRFDGDLKTLVLNPTTPTEVTLGLGDIKVQVVSARSFTNEKEMKAWAKVWFAKNAERFITARVSIPGLGQDDLRCNQVHKFTGMGEPFDGNYYFSRVRHSLGAGEEYKIDADVRKVFTP